MNNWYNTLTEAQKEAFKAKVREGQAKKANTPTAKVESVTRKVCVKAEDLRRLNNLRGWIIDGNLLQLVVDSKLYFVWGFVEGLPVQAMVTTTPFNQDCTLLPITSEIIRAMHDELPPEAFTV
jgi:hypothetical protein